MDKIVDVFLNHAERLLDSWKLQIPTIVLSILLWIYPAWLQTHIPSKLDTLRAYAPLITCCIVAIWGYKICLMAYHNKKRQQNICKYLHDIITCNAIHSSHYNNNLLYILYTHKLKHFTFGEISNYMEELDISSDEGLEEVLMELCKNNVIVYKKGIYQLPHFVWKELYYFANSKQLRKKRCY